jgi:glycosyltransferase involved in cell wall biosynthesis
MVFAIDGRGLAGAPRGVARYATGMLDALRAGHPQDDLVLVEAGAPGTGRGHAVRMGLTGRPPLERLAGGADAVWAPAPRPLAVGARTGLVLTVHDRSWEERPGDFTAYERLWHRVARPRRLAARADRVLFDAPVVRDDVVAAWGLDAARVRVAAPGVDAPVRPLAPLPPGLPARWFVWVGALEPRKAPDVLAAAWARARADGLQAGLVVVGTGRQAGALDLPGAVRLGAVDAPTLATLLTHALAVVAPSRGEGYGLVPREALAHGTPAVVTDLPVWRDALGDAALRVPVDDAEALAAALRRLEDEPGLRAQLVAAAPPQPTWAAAADVLHVALHEAAAERRRGGR